MPRELLETHFGANNNSASRISHLLSHFVSGRNRRAMRVCQESVALCTEPCASLWALWGGSCKG